MSCKSALLSFSLPLLLGHGNLEFVAGIGAFCCVPRYLHGEITQGGVIGGLDRESSLRVPVLDDGSGRFDADSLGQVLELECDVLIEVFPTIDADGGRLRFPLLEFRSDARWVEREGIV